MHQIYRSAEQLVLGIWGYCFYGVDVEELSREAVTATTIKYAVTLMILYADSDDAILPHLL